MDLPRATVDLNDCDDSAAVRKTRLVNGARVLLVSDCSNKV